MAEAPRTGELVTTNFGWVKPTVASSPDAWGGYINADLDGIDSVVHGIQTSVPAASTTAPVMDGTAAAGSATAWSRGDHVHPTDTSRYAAANPAGYQTAAQVTAALGPYYLASNPAAYVTAAGAAAAAPVQSVAGKTGAVTLVHTDITDWAASMPAAYVLPTASTTVLGGVKVDGTTITIAGGVISGAPSGVSQSYVDTQDALRVLKAGDTMTGQLTLAANPAAPLQAATKQYVDALPVAIGDNRIINGDMRIDQRNNGASGTGVNVYTVDRWYYGSNQAAKGTWQRINGGPGWLSLGLGYYLMFTSASAYAALAGDLFRFNQPIEADQIADLAWGTANAQPITLSFWVVSSLSGTFSGAIRNYAATRSYVFTYSLTANVLTKIAVTIPGDTAGTWVLQGNSGGLSVDFDLGCGSTFQTAPGAWTSGNFIKATGSVSVIATSGATFSFTGVKLEIGSVATPFNRQSLTKSQADCERYFRWLGYNASFFAAAASQYLGQTCTFPVMRAAPTVSAAAADPNVAGSFANAANNTFDQITPYSLRMLLTATAAGACYVVGWRVSASAEL